MRSCVLGFILLTAACQSPPQDSASRAAPPAPASTLTRFRPESLAFAQLSGYQSATQLVIRDQAAWDQAWKTLHASVDPVPPTPAIDFDKEMVLLAALGARSTGGHDILLESATPEGDHQVVSVREREPGAGCLTSQILTQPADIARIPKTEQAITFTVKHESKSCS